MNFYPSSLPKNDKKASLWIWTFSAIVFLTVVLLDQIEVSVDLGFNPHVFAFLSALINLVVSILLILALVYVRRNDIDKHRKTMESAMYLSVFFLLFYIAHHLFTGSTLYGDVNHDGIVSEAEKLAVGNIRYFYYFLISTHITLAGLVMPFVLYSAYAALTHNIDRHKKLVKYTYPVWLYVAITGVLVFLMISPYYT